MANKKKIDKDKLIELVVGDIKNDIEAGDVTAVEELLKFCPTENLMAYLPEDVSKKLDIALDPKPKAVTHCSVYILDEPVDKTIAAARVQLYDELQLTDLRIVNGVHGLYVAYPTNPKCKKDDIRSMYYPLTAALRAEIEETLLAKYKELIK